MRGAGSVDADDGGFRPWAGAFRAVAADAEGQEVADGVALEEDGAGAIGLDGEVFKNLRIGRGADGELILVEVGIGHAAPAGFHFPGVGGVFKREAGGRGDGLGPGGGALEIPAGADKGFIPAVDGLAGGGGTAEAFDGVAHFQRFGGAGTAEEGLGGGAVFHGLNQRALIGGEGGQDVRGQVLVKEIPSPAIPGNADPGGQGIGGELGPILTDAAGDGGGALGGDGGFHSLDPLGGSAAVAGAFDFGLYHGMDPVGTALAFLGRGGVSFG